MKKQLFSVLTLLALCIAFGACEKELEIQKKGNLGSIEDFYKTDGEAEQAISTVYTSWRSINNSLFMVLELLSDDAWTGGGYRGDQIHYQEINTYEFGSDNSAVEEVFTGLYGIIYNANLVITYVAPDSEAKKRCLAEAYFFRGWAHFYLGTMWGTPPVVDHLLQPSEYAAGNSAVGDCYVQAETDFNQAIELNALKSKSGVDDKVAGIRITREAVYAFLGKTYLFHGDKAKAAAALNQAITSNLYGLYEGSYADVLKPVAEFCRESVLESNAVEDLNVFGMDVWGVWHGYRNDKFEWAMRDTVVYRDVNEGYGFDNPRKQLYDAFKTHNTAGGGNDYRLNATIKDYAFLRDSVKISTLGAIHGNEGYFNWKMRFLKSEMTQDLQGWNIWVHLNFRYMRYAEVLLLAAEANLDTDNGKALTYINEVRTRAKLTPLTSVTLADIKQEKRFELCFEGMRWLDLVRWGDAYDVLKDQGKQVMQFDGTAATLEYTANGGFQQGKHELLPIPAKERLINPSINQNEGW